MKNVFLSILIVFTMSCVPTIRPTGEVAFLGTGCGCLNQKATTFGNCATICSAKKDKNLELIYLDFTVSENIHQSILNSTQGWCNTVLIDPKTKAPIDGGNPRCYLEAKEITQNITINLPATTAQFTGPNSIKTDISVLRNAGPEGSVWILTLVENSSGAKSNSVQIKLKDNLSILGPLKVASVNQYNCVKWSSDDISYQQNFFYVDKFYPELIHDDATGFNCREEFLKPDQSVGYLPRNLNDNAFKIWDANDPRFYDNDGVNGIDINQMLKSTMEYFGQGANINLDLFFRLNWQNGPEIAPGNRVTSNQRAPIGYIMKPWIDRTTNLSYCPGNGEYQNSENPIFLALKEVLGVETEGIYLAKRENVASANRSDLEDDFVLLPESKLKKIWFYVEQGRKYIPTESTVTSKTIHFYWPADIYSPFVRQGNQKLYTIYHPNEIIGGIGVSTSSSGNSYITHDKKFGCIPKSP